MYKVLVCDDRGSEITEMSMELAIIEKDANIDENKMLQVIPVTELNEASVRLAVQGNHPDIVIMDLCDMKTVPGKKLWVGAELIKTLKDGPAKEIPIIIWTQLELTPYKEATLGIRAGARDIVFKPKPTEKGQVRKEKYKDLYDRTLAALKKSDARKAERAKKMEQEQRKINQDRKFNFWRSLCDAIAAVLMVIASLVIGIANNDEVNFLIVAQAILIAIFAIFAYLTPNIMRRRESKRAARESSSSKIVS